MWDKVRIQELLQSNDRAVIRAIKAIYAAQTDSEKQNESTIASNGVGFNHADARRGTYYAQYIERTGRLTGKHLEVARKMAMKYWRQLAEIANQDRQVQDARVAEANRVDEYLAKQFRQPAQGEDVGNYLEEKMVFEEVRNSTKLPLAAGTFS